MDVTVYLPDEIGGRAKEAELPFSRLLRAAVEAELARRDAVADALSEDVAEHKVDLGDYDGLINGIFLGETSRSQFYLTDDERVLVYDSNRQHVEELEDPGPNLTAWLQNDSRESEALAGIMLKLGIRPQVRL